jgi:preprotein translocase subunit SecY
LTKPKGFLEALKIEALRKKFLYTLAIIVVFRLGAQIVIPGVDPEKLQSFFGGGGFLGFVDLFSGGALSSFSIFALGIIPYINASIIMQLLTFIYPSLKELQEEGESGRKQIQQYTRYLTITLAVLQSTAMSFGFKSMLFADTNFSFFVISAVISLTAGSTLIMWLGELITENGIGNGASLIIFVGIISQMPGYIGRTVTLVKGGIHPVNVLVLVVILLAVVVGIVIVQEAQRNIPVQYAKKVVGQKSYGGQNTYLPLKINQGGVIPIIFASSVLAFPVTISKFVPKLNAVGDALAPGEPFYLLLFSSLIFFFTYFYTALTFNPKEISENIKRYGGFILGVRPGQQTADYLDKIITRLTFIGALFLALIAILPMIGSKLTNVTSFVGLGGTALLIIVGVAIDLVRQIETVIISSQYEGFER